ncbi:hypothetical protein C8Q75DRAFT_555605 [Abortiporus biennis]|nr:hypothetical protein C8Q75DRAFT_555605 [Abortiporus biennis]
MQLLIRYPRISTRSPFGCAMKGFVALDLAEKKLKFLKDSWRYNGGDYHPEIEVYEKLQKVGVKNIAKVEGGDVLGVDGKPQTTVAHVHLNKNRNPDDTEEYLEQRHYRLLIRQLGTPLEKYRDSYSLCYYICLIIYAHCLAWEAGVLHRDISPNNILIDEEATDREQQAFLIDWDLCRYRHELSQGRSQKSRSGAWAFTSAPLLKFPTKQHDLPDDLESFIHVLHWFSLRFHTYNMTGDPGLLAQKVSSVYFNSRRIEGYDLGGDEKFELMRNGGVCFTFDKKNVAPGLIKLVKRLTKLCKKHYTTFDFDALEASSAKVLKKETTSLEDAELATVKEVELEPQPLSFLARFKSDSVTTGNTPSKVKTEHPSSKTDEGRTGTNDDSDGQNDTRTSNGNPDTTVVDTSDDDDDYVVPENPFAAHVALLQAFGSLLDKTELWQIPHPRNKQLKTRFDKTKDQFNVAMHSTLSVAPTTIEQLGNKRKPTTAGLGTGSETTSKRARGSNAKSTALVASGSKQTSTGERMIKSLKLSKTQGTSQTKSSTRGKKKVDDGPVVPDEPDAFMD